MPEPLAGSASSVGEHRDLDAEHGRAAPWCRPAARSARRRGARPAPRRRAAARAGWSRPRRRAAVRPGEREPVVGAADAPVLELRLGDGGAEVDVPQRRRLARRRPRRGRGCAGRPAARRGGSGRRSWRTSATSRPTGRGARHSRSKTCSSSAVSRWHSSTKLRRETGTRVASVGLAGGCRSRGRRAGTGRSGRRSVLHPALGGQAVVVPADRVEDLAAAHPLEPGDGVGVGVREDVPRWSAPLTVGGGVSMA